LRAVRERPLPIAIAAVEQPDIALNRLYRDKALGFGLSRQLG
jgi:hypothetical protein